MIDWEQTIEVGKIIGMVAVAIGVAIRGRGWIMRKSAEDGAIIAADDARVDMLKRALDEADRHRSRADLASKERNEAVSRMGALEAQVHALEQHKIDCDRRIAAMEAQLTVLRQIIDRRLTPRS